MKAFGQPPGLARSKLRDDDQSSALSADAKQSVPPILDADAMKNRAHDTNVRNHQNTRNLGKAFLLEAGKRRNSQSTATLARTAYFSVQGSWLETQGTNGGCRWVADS